MAVMEKLEKFIQDNVFQSNLTEEEMRGREEIEASCESTLMGPWSYRQEREAVS